MNDKEYFHDDLREDPYEESCEEPTLTEKTDKYVPYVTYTLLAVNVIAFAVCTFTGNLLYNKGAFGVDHLTGWDQVYRFVTSMFLHINVMHLSGNMIMLLAAGPVIEKNCGRIFFTILYFLSGIGGNLLSTLWDIASGEHYISVGASGAVMGVVGALAVCVIAHRGRFKEFNLPRMLLMIVYIFYSGLTTEKVNNMAHFGGIFVGSVITLLYELIVGSGKRKAGDNA